MFNEIIEIEKREQIRYGTTKVSFNKTFGQIIELLRKRQSPPPKGGGMRETSAPD